MSNASLSALRPIGFTGLGVLMRADVRGTAQELQTLRFKQDPRPTFQATNTTSRPPPEQPTATGKRHQVEPMQSPQCLVSFPSEQPKSRAASLIARAYRIPKRD